MLIEIKNNQEKGPGYARIFLSARSGSLPISEDQLTEPCFIIESPGRSEYLGQGQWVQAESRLKPDAFFVEDGTLVLEVGPAVVNNLEALENYRFTLLLPDFTKSGALVCQNLIPAPIQGGNTSFGNFEPEDTHDAQAQSTPPEEENLSPDLEEAAVEEIKQPDVQEMPETESPPQPDTQPEQSELVASPDNLPSAPLTAQALELGTGTPPNAEKTPAMIPELGNTGKTRSKSGKAAALVLVLLLLIALGGVFYFLNKFPGETPVLNGENATESGLNAENGTEAADAPDKQNKPEPAQSEELPAPEKPAPEEPAPEKPAPKPDETGNEAARPAPLQSARELLRSGPDNAAIRRNLSMLPLNPENADANFLLREELAQRGDAESMYLLAQFYDPVQSLPTGSIEKDPEQAIYWYAQAAAGGWQSAGPALKQLKTWLQNAAGEGDMEAQRLLESLE